MLAVVEPSLFRSGLEGVSKYNAFIALTAGESPAIEILEDFDRHITDTNHYRPVVRNQQVRFDGAPTAVLAMQFSIALLLIWDGGFAS